MTPWYTIHNIDIIDSPALVIYPDRIKENIQRLIEMAGAAERLRPHVKTNKIAEVCKLMKDAGITKFKCATIAEAEMLAGIDAHDVLLAHQPVGPKAGRLLQLVMNFRATHFSCIIDNFSTAATLSELFQKNNLQLPVFIDLNIGMNRSGCKPEAALTLYKQAQSLTGIKIIGLHAYDGHIRDTDLSERNRQSDEAFAKVDWLVKEITSLNPTPMQIVVGGSPSFPTHTKRKAVQFSPGTFVFWDWGYKHIVPDEPFEYAALVITRVVSIIDQTTICTDLGHKSVAAENPLPRVHFLNAPDANPISQSEEHLVVNVPDSSVWKVGDTWYGVPVHICPTVALYDNATVILNHQQTDCWRVIARARKITI
ncbi:MAG: D-TA family PLP-dependent enzyme [Bacteroidota bacterium]